MNQPSVQQHIQAPVNGPVAGRDVHYYEQYVVHRDTTFWDWPADQLRKRLQAVRAERREACLRIWLNWPALILSCVMLGLIGVVATMGLAWQESAAMMISNRTSNRGAASIVMLGVACAVGSVLFFVGKMLNRIRRFETIVIRDIETEIDTIALVLRRKYGR